MMNNSKILYIGNNLQNSTNYITTIDSLSKSLKGLGFKVYTSSRIKNKFFRFLDMCYSVIRYQSRVDYILIDTYSTSNFYFAYFTSQLSRIFNVKYIPILHGGGLPNRLKNNPNLSRHVFKNSYLNISPSGYLKDIFSTNGYSTQLIKNTIDIDTYSFKERVILEPKLLFVRAFAKMYNPTMAIHVLSKLKENFPEATLCMIGPDKDGELEASINLAKKLNILDSVEFCGVLSKKDWHKKSIDCDVFINTTNVDNTPVSVIEAMALGLPIVSTNVGGIPYLIEDKVDGLLVEKNNVKQMTENIKSLLNNEHKDVPINARTKAESYAWEVVKYKWLELLK